MKWFIIKRLFLMLLVTWGVTLLVFTALRLAPGDPVMAIALARYGGIENISARDLELIRKQEGLDAPFHVQYGRWLGHVLKGDLGQGLVDGRPVAREIFRRFPATLELALASLLTAISISIPLGLASAVKPDSPLDHLGMTGALVGVSIPNFWLALLLILLFSVHLGWLPISGTGSLGHIVLPALTLGTGLTAFTTRLTRSCLLEVLGQNYIRTARAKGLPAAIILGKHALKNTAVPLITFFGLQFAFLLEGTVIVETIFAWPGIGRLLVESIFSRDFAMIQGCAIFMALIFSLVNLAVDIICAYLDPRIRYDRKLS